MYIIYICDIKIYVANIQATLEPFSHLRISSKNVGQCISDDLHRFNGKKKKKKMQQWKPVCYSYISEQHLNYSPILPHRYIFCTTCKIIRESELLSLCLNGLQSLLYWTPLRSHSFNCCFETPSHYV